jgi:hypothetical protein
VHLLLFPQHTRPRIPASLEFGRTADPVCRWRRRPKHNMTHGEQSGDG